MADGKQYLVRTEYKDGSRRRKVMTLDELREHFAKAEPIFPGATMIIEDL